MQFLMGIMAIMWVVFAIYTVVDIKKGENVDTLLTFLLILSTGMCLMAGLQTLDTKLDQIQERQDKIEVVLIRDP